MPIVMMLFSNKTASLSRWDKDADSVPFSSYQLFIKMCRKDTDYYIRLAEELGFEFFDEVGVGKKAVQQWFIYLDD